MENGHRSLARPYVLYPAASRVLYLFVTKSRVYPFASAVSAVAFRRPIRRAITFVSTTTSPHRQTHKRGGKQELWERVRAGQREPKHRGHRPQGISGWAHLLESLESLRREFCKYRTVSYTRSACAPRRSRCLLHVPHASSQPRPPPDPVQFPPASQTPARV
jgi:hypothetical protein